MGSVGLLKDISFGGFFLTPPLYHSLPDLTPGNRSDESEARNGELQIV